MAVHSDVYRTLAKPVRASQKIQGSTFLARCFPVKLPDEAKQIVVQIEKQDYDATHHPYAYRIGAGHRLKERFSDAGEPSRTAGIPILKAIVGEDLTNVLVVVSRWFGGTKLGTGNLTRAYRATALLALKKAVIVTEYPQCRISFSVPLRLIGVVHPLLALYSAVIISETYHSRASYCVKLPESRLSRLRSDLVEKTAGNVTFLLTEKEGW